ncbi:MAG TPA: oxygenase MpaB family protein [Acidimicrobiales bacterium]|nr:oxygenase MpaB family protein [Acidimicrobiales bacterium]
MTKTIVQRRATDVRIYGAAGYALCLQVAHPTIAAGVRDHSNYVTDPWGRFVGTADFVNLLVYGRSEQVTAATRGLREMHKRIRGTDLDGTKYSALEPSAYAWVHATLAEAIVRGHDVFGSRLRPGEKQDFWTEWLRLGALMGVREGDLPDTWDGFQGYLRTMIDDVLVHTDVIDAVQSKAADAVGGSPMPWIPPRVWGYAGRPLGKLGAFLARGTMGPELRAKFDIPWSRAQQQRFESIAALSRRARPVMLPPLRHAGPLALKLRRREITKGPFA